jgi:ribosomal protein S18 acetylase RimI-like enzyme
MTPSPVASRLFRPGGPADARAIRSILVESNLSAPAPGHPERSTPSGIGEILTFVCEQNHELVGVLQWRNLGDDCEILDLAVRQIHRRQGHASFLLEKFLRHAARSPLRKIYLEVRESSAPAIALYKKFGFQVTGRRPGYYRSPDESALLMTFPPEA